MASDNETSCVSDPNFAVICSFLERFAKSCGITHPNISELQDMLENSLEVPQPLVDLHVKLLRKARKSVSGERWEKAIIKFCHSYSNQDGWEIERFGYKKARIAVKLRILKMLLELQFDLNTKFKTEVNRLSANELRCQSLGRDKLGQTYWCQLDEDCNLRVYREDLDDETWEIVARDREGLVQLISQLSSNDPFRKDTEGILNEDSNSLGIEKPITDTGQTTDLREGESSVIETMSAPLSMVTITEGAEGAAAAANDDKDKNESEKINYEDNGSGDKVELISEGNDNNVKNKNDDKLKSEKQLQRKPEKKLGEEPELEQVMKERVKEQVIEEVKESKIKEKAEMKEDLKPATTEEAKPTTKDASQSDIIGQLTSVPKEELKLDTREELKEVTKDQLKSESKRAMKPETSSTLTLDTKEVSKPQTEESREVKGELKPETGRETKSAVRSSSKVETKEEFLSEITGVSQSKSKEEPKPEIKGGVKGESDSKLLGKKELKAEMKFDINMDFKLKAKSDSKIEIAEQSKADVKWEVTPLHKLETNFKQFEKKAEERKDMKQVMYTRPTTGLFSTSSDTSSVMIPESSRNENCASRETVSKNEAAICLKEIKTNPNVFSTQSDYYGVDLTKSSRLKKMDAEENVGIDLRSRIYVEDRIGSSREKIDHINDNISHSNLVAEDLSGLSRRSKEAAGKYELDMFASSPLTATDLSTKRPSITNVLQGTKVPLKPTILEYGAMAAKSLKMQSENLIGKRLLDNDLSNEAKKLRLEHTMSMNCQNLASVPHYGPESFINDESSRVSEPIEEPLMLVRGEGSGADCDTGNPGKNGVSVSKQTHNLPSKRDGLLETSSISSAWYKCDNFDNEENFEVSEAIEDPLMLVYGEGSGADCDTGNPSKDGEESSKQTCDSTSKRDEGSLETSVTKSESCLSSEESPDKEEVLNSKENLDKSKSESSHLSFNRLDLVTNKNKSASSDANTDQIENSDTTSVLNTDVDGKEARYKVDEKEGKTRVLPTILKENEGKETDKLQKNCITQKTNLDGDSIVYETIDKRKETHSSASSGIQPSSSNVHTQDLQFDSGLHVKKSPKNSSCETSRDTEATNTELPPKQPPKLWSIETICAPDEKPREIAKSSGGNIKPSCNSFLGVVSDNMYGEKYGVKINDKETSSQLLPKTSSPVKQASRWDVSISDKLQRKYDSDANKITMQEGANSGKEGTSKRNRKEVLESIKVDSVSVLGSEKKTENEEKVIGITVAGHNKKCEGEMESKKQIADAVHSKDVSGAALGDPGEPQTSFDTVISVKSTDGDNSAESSDTKKPSTQGFFFGPGCLLKSPIKKASDSTSGVGVSSDTIPNSRSLGNVNHLGIDLSPRRSTNELPVKKPDSKESDHDKLMTPLSPTQCKKDLSSNASKSNTPHSIDTIMMSPHKPRETCGFQLSFQTSPVAPFQPAGVSTAVLQDATGEVVESTGVACASKISVEKLCISSQPSTHKELMNTSVEKSSHSQEKDKEDSHSLSTQKFQEQITDQKRTKDSLLYSGISSNVISDFENLENSKESMKNNPTHIEIKKDKNNFETDCKKEISIIDKDKKQTDNSIFEKMNECISEVKTETKMQSPSIDRKICTAKAKSIKEKSDERGEKISDVVLTNTGHTSEKIIKDTDVLAKKDSICTNNESDKNKITCEETNKNKKEEDRSPCSSTLPSLPNLSSSKEKLHSDRILETVHTDSSELIVGTDRTCGENFKEQLPVKDKEIRKFTLKQLCKPVEKDSVCETDVQVLEKNTECADRNPDSLDNTEKKEFKVSSVTEKKELKVPSYEHTECESKVSANIEQGEENGIRHTDKCSTRQLKLVEDKNINKDITFDNLSKSDNLVSEKLDQPKTICDGRPPSTQLSLDSCKINKSPCTISCEKDDHLNIQAGKKKCSVPEVLEKITDTRAKDSCSKSNALEKCKEKGNSDIKNKDISATTAKKEDSAESCLTATTKGAISSMEKDQVEISVIPKEKNKELLTETERCVTVINVDGEKAETSKSVEVVTNIESTSVIKDEQMDSKEKCKNVVENTVVDKCKKIVDKNSSEIETGKTKSTDPLLKVEDPVMDPKIGKNEPQGITSDKRKLTKESSENQFSNSIQQSSEKTMILSENKSVTTPPKIPILKVKPLSELIYSTPPKPLYTLGEKGITGENLSFVLGSNKMHTFPETPKETLNKTSDNIIKLQNNSFEKFGCKAPEFMEVLSIDKPIKERENKKNSENQVAKRMNDKSNIESTLGSPVIVCEVSDIKCGKGNSNIKVVDLTETQDTSQVRNEKQVSEFLSQPLVEGFTKPSRAILDGQDSLTALKESVRALPTVSGKLSTMNSGKGKPDVQAKGRRKSLESISMGIMMGKLAAKSSIQEPININVSDKQPAVSGETGPKSQVMLGMPIVPCPLKTSNKKTISELSTGSSLHDMHDTEAFLKANTLSASDVNTSKSGIPPAVLQHDALDFSVKPVEASKVSNSSTGKLDNVISSRENIHKQSDSVKLSGEKSKEHEKNKVRSEKSVEDKKPESQSSEKSKKGDTDIILPSTSNSERIPKLLTLSNDTTDTLHVLSKVKSVNSADIPKRGVDKKSAAKKSASSSPIIAVSTDVIESASTAVPSDPTASIVPPANAIPSTSLSLPADSASSKAGSSPSAASAPAEKSTDVATSSSAATSPSESVKSLVVSVKPTVSSLPKAETVDPIVSATSSTGSSLTLQAFSIEPSSQPEDVISSTVLQSPCSPVSSTTSISAVKSPPSIASGTSQQEKEPSLSPDVHNGNHKNTPEKTRVKEKTRGRPKQGKSTQVSHKDREKVIEPKTTEDQKLRIAPVVLVKAEKCESYIARPSSQKVSQRTSPERVSNKRVTRSRGSENLTELPLRSTRSGRTTKEPALERNKTAVEKPDVSKESENVSQSDNSLTTGAEREVPQVKGNDKEAFPVVADAEPPLETQLKTTRSLRRTRATAAYKPEPEELKGSKRNRKSGVSDVTSTAVDPNSSEDDKDQNQFADPEASSEGESETGFGGRRGLRAGVSRRGAASAARGRRGRGRGSRGRGRLSRGSALAARESHTDSAPASTTPTKAHDPNSDSTSAPATAAPATAAPATAAPATAAPATAAPATAAPAIAAPATAASATAASATATPATAAPTTPTPSNSATESQLQLESELESPPTATHSPGHASVRAYSVKGSSHDEPVKTKQEESKRLKTTPTPKTKSNRGKRTPKLLGLDLGVDIVLEESRGGEEEGEGCASTLPMRQSRRIAQMKIKEEAERRKLEELTLFELKEQSRRKIDNRADKDIKGDKKKRKKKVAESDEDFTADDIDEDAASKKKLKKKKKRRKKKLLTFNESNPWQSSSGSSSSQEEDELDVEQTEEEEDEELVFKSDHEFSPESDLENDASEVTPTRRARTAQKGLLCAEDEEEPADEHACQKCGKSDHPEWILLCDKCDSGWHGSCLRPALMVIPEGDWFCPPCEHTFLLENLHKNLLEFDRNWKRRENEELRRKRLAYVGISLDNVLPNKDKEGASGGESAVESKKDQQAVSSSNSESSGSESDSSSGDESEPVYQLRQRRQALFSYRFNEYDDLINSAIQDELEAMKGAGNQGRGKDIATIVKAEAEELKASQMNIDNMKIEEDKVEKEVKEELATETDKEIAPIPPLKLQSKKDDDDDEEDDFCPFKKFQIKKKHRRLNSLDISSDDDAESDEDFKGSSSEDEEDDFEDGSEGSDDSAFVGRHGKGKSRRRAAEPVRRSSRARVTRFDKEFINDDSDDSEPPRKKSRRSWQDSDSEESDVSWGRTKRKKVPTFKTKTKKKKKRRNKRNLDSDLEGYRAKKPKIKYGRLNDDDDDDDDDMSPTRRTRGRKINYQEVGASDSEEEQWPKSKKLESEDEYVVNEEEDDEEDDAVEDMDKDSENSDDESSGIKVRNAKNKNKSIKSSPDKNEKKGMKVVKRRKRLIFDDSEDEVGNSEPENKTCEENVTKKHTSLSDGSTEKISEPPQEIQKKEVPVVKTLPSETSLLSVSDETKDKSTKCQSPAKKQEEPKKRGRKKKKCEDAEDEFSESYNPIIIKDVIKDDDDEDEGEEEAEEEEEEDEEEEEEEEEDEEEEEEEEEEDDEEEEEEDDDVISQVSEKQVVPELLGSPNKTVSKVLTNEIIGEKSSVRKSTSPTVSPSLKGNLDILPDSEHSSMFTNSKSNLETDPLRNLLSTPPQLLSANDSDSFKIAGDAVSVAGKRKGRGRGKVGTAAATTTTTTTVTVSADITKGPELGHYPQMQGFPSHTAAGAGNGVSVSTTSCTNAATSASGGSVITRMLQAQPVSGTPQSFTAAAAAMGHKYFGNSSSDSSLMSVPSTGHGTSSSTVPSYTGPPKAMSSTYRQQTDGSNSGLGPSVSHYVPSSARGQSIRIQPAPFSQTGNIRLRNPPPTAQPQHMFHTPHHPLDPSPSGGGPIIISSGSSGPPPPTGSPLTTKPGTPSSHSTPTPPPPPPPYSRTGPQISLAPPSNTLTSMVQFSLSPGDTPPQPGRHPSATYPPATSASHMQASQAAQPSPPPPGQGRSPVPGNFSPYHPPPPANYHYGGYPPPPPMSAADDALPPSAFQGSPYTDHYTSSDMTANLQASDGSNSKSYDEEGGGEFGGLVSYFSSQREDDLDT